MSSALIGLGSNLGDRRAMLDRAIEALNATPQVQVVRISRWRAHATDWSAGGRR